MAGLLRSVRLVGLPLQGLLEEEGFQVLVATSGERALTRLAHMRPDLILMDVNMPGINGYETCRQLKADLRWRDVPVLFLTALDDAADKLRGFEAGAWTTSPSRSTPGRCSPGCGRTCNRALQRTLEEKNALLVAAMAWRLEAEKQLQ